MASDVWLLYELMMKSRLYEGIITKLWHDGYISGEMHLGTGEEGIVAGIVSQLLPDDAMALDHRATSALLMRGVDPVLMLREMLGFEDGLCGGMGGHMHLLSKEFMAASSGIVGAGGPAAAGFALAAQYLRPGSIAVAFFGEGAMNQGMLIESMNLAAAWNLPVLFICKDDGWSITTPSEKMTGGGPKERAQAFGIPAFEADGTNVVEVWNVAYGIIEQIRAGNGPSFIHARCVHFEGHFLGFQLLKIAKNPIREIPRISGPLTHALLRPGGGVIRDRIAGLKTVISTVLKTIRDSRKDPANDPLINARKLLEPEPERLRKLENRIEKNISNILETVVGELSP